MASTSTSDEHEGERCMTRFLFKLIICVVLAGAAGFAYFAYRSGDPVYTFHEWISPARFQQYDNLIRNVGAEHQIDPMLVKAVVWRESRFDPQKFGTAGERGLMQVSEGAPRNGRARIIVTIFAWKNFSIQK